MKETSSSLLEFNKKEFNKIPNSGILNDECGIRPAAARKGSNGIRVLRNFFLSNFYFTCLQVNAKICTIQFTSINFIGF